MPKKKQTRVEPRFDLQSKGFTTKGWRIYLGVFQLLASTLETLPAIFPIDDG